MSEEGFQAGYLLMKAMQPRFTLGLVWLMSHPVCAEVNNAMQQLNYWCTIQHKWAAQRLDHGKAGEYMADACELLKFLESRIPFRDNCSLRSIVTGINAGSSVNVDTEK